MGVNVMFCRFCSGRRKFVPAVVWVSRRHHSFRTLSVKENHELNRLLKNNSLNLDFRVLCLVFDLVALSTLIWLYLQNYSLFSESMGLVGGGGYSCSLEPITLTHTCITPPTHTTIPTLLIQSKASTC